MARKTSISGDISADLLVQSLLASRCYKVKFGSLFPRFVIAMVYGAKRFRFTCRDSKVWLKGSVPGVAGHIEDCRVRGDTVEFWGYSAVVGSITD